MAWRITEQEFVATLDANTPALTQAQIDELKKALPKRKIFHNAKK